MTNIVKTEQNYAVSTVGAVDFADMANELEGLGAITLDNVKVPSGGGITFEVPSDDPNNPNVEKALTGVVVYHNPLNSYWSKPFTGENEAPDCMSINAKQGIDLATGECKNCLVCPLNKFGDNGEGKKCRNMHRLYILLQGATMPIVLNVPPSSLGAFKTYITKAVLLRGRKLNNVVTQITLKKAQSKTGITYSQLQFAKVGDLTPEQVAEFAPLAELCKTLSMQLPDKSNNDEQELDNIINEAEKEQVLKDKPIEFENVETL